MTEIQPAPDQLVALARAMRPAWDHDVLAAAILAAKNAGWTWDHVLTETVRLMRREDASPFDLRAAAASPLRVVKAGPDTTAKGAALARELFERRNEDGVA